MCRVSVGYMATAHGLRPLSTAIPRPPPISPQWSVVQRLAANPTPPRRPIAMASPAAASPARRFSSIFSSTKPRARPVKPAPEPAQAPKAPATQAGAKPDERHEPRNLTKIEKLIFREHDPRTRNLTKIEKLIFRERDPRNLTKIEKLIFRERDPDKLVSRFIAESTASYRFRHKHHVYEVAVARLASYGRHDAIAAIIDSQKPFIKASSVGFAARLVRLCGSASMPSHAAAIFHDLPPKHKSVMTFNALLAAYVDARDFDALATAFQQIPASHPTIVPTVYSYNILISGLCQKPELFAALDVITLMEKHGVSPNIISFNILLNGFYNNDSFDDAEKVWELMKERNVEPDVKSYNAKLRGLVYQAKVEDAVALIERMQKEGPKPDSVSYNELIRGYCKEGRLNEAKKVYDDLIKNECAPNRGTFHTLVPHLVEAGEHDIALSCCHEIFSRKCKVQCSLLQGVVTALIAASRMEDAMRIVHLGRTNYYSRKGLRMPPDTREDKGLKMPQPDGEDNDVEGDADPNYSVSYEDGYEEEKESKNAQRRYTFVI